MDVVWMDGRARSVDVDVDLDENGTKWLAIMTWSTNGRPQEKAKSSGLWS